MKMNRLRELMLVLITSILPPLSLGLVSCGSPPAKLSPKSQTSAELRAIRRGVAVIHPGAEARAPYAKERLGEGASVKVDNGGLAWLRRDEGATLLIRGPAELVIEAEGVRIKEGQVFAETTADDPEKLYVPEGELVLSLVRTSLEVRGGKTEAYVLSGEIATSKIKASSGEILSLAGDGSVRPALAWEDWTGGLATTDKNAEPAPFGVGTVGARVPGALGAPHSPLTIARLDVRVTIDGDLAITEVDQTFFNPFSNVVEGLYRLRVPEGSIIERFGVDRGDDVVYGYVKEKKRAEAQYQANVYQGSKEDPALLAWREPGVYEARLYPIGPGASRRVILRYSEWLHRSGEAGERRLYTYPMASEGSEASAPLVEDLSIAVDLSKAGAKEIRSGMEAQRLGDQLLVSRHDRIPRADFSLELFDDGPKKLVAVRAEHRPDPVMISPEDTARDMGKEPDYLMVPIALRDLPAAEAGLDVVVVVDTSAGTDAATLRLARAATRALLAHLGDSDRVLVLSGDDRLSPIGDSTALEKVTAEVRSATHKALSNLRAGGATDLAAMLYDATTKLGDTRQGVVVYLGDGRATVGETTLASIREKQKAAPRKVRLFGLGLGDGADMALLSGLSTGGYAARITDERTAAKAALQVLELGERPGVLDFEVELGAGVERVYPRDQHTLIGGQTIFSVGRVVGDLPESVTVKHSGKSVVLPIEVRKVDDLGDLRRRWAEGRLHELLAEGAGPAALVDLGVRQGIITPYTSIYVPTTKEMTPEMRARSRAESKSRRIEREQAEKQLAASREKAKPKKPGFFDQLLRSKSDSEPATVSATPEESADNKEGGTGTRARGEEGSMGRGNKGSPAPQAAAAATAMPSAPSVAAEPEPDAANNDADQADSPKKLAKTEDKPNDPAQPASAPPAMPAGRPYVEKPGALDERSGADGWGRDDSIANAPDSGALTLEIEGKQGLGLAGVGDGGGGIGLGSIGTIGHGAGAGTGSGFGAGEGRFGGKNGKDGDFEATITRGPLPRNTTVIVLIDDPGRRKKLCGPGADLPLGERQNLWRERLTRAGVSPHGVVSVYRQALALCEAPTPRERRALLLLGLDMLPSITLKVTAYRLFEGDLGAADIVYRAILARITRPEEAREFNQALGLASVDSQTLEKLWKDVPDPAKRAEKLRALTTQFPGDLDLALVLLDTLEDAGDEVGARDHATTLRGRSDANAAVRTAVGELFLRLAKKTENAAQKDKDEREAKRAFGELVEFSPSDPVARRRLGDLYRAHGYYQEAARQYETLAELLPDDPTAALLLSMCSNGLGKLEEAVRLTEKGGQAGAPDALIGPHATARALATAFLAWGRELARKEGKADELKGLLARHDRVLGAKGLERSRGNVRVLMTWAHPEFRPTLWTDALGSPMPAAEGDATLGIMQSLSPASRPANIEVRVEPGDLARAARLGQKALLTVVFDEGTDSEKIVTREVSFAADGKPVLRLRATAGELTEVAQ